MLRLIRQRVAGSAVAAAAAPATAMAPLALCAARPACAVARAAVRCFSSSSSSSTTTGSAEPDSGAAFSEGRPTAPRAPLGRDAYLAAHAPAPLDPSRPPPRNPLKRLLTPEPEDLTEVFGNLSINWFPGHMAAAKQALASRVSQCHLVLEVRDARIPFSSGNPELERLFHQKRRILVFNKTDVADPRTFGPLRRFFEARGQPVMLMAGDPFKPKRLNKRTITGPLSAAKQTGVNRAQMRALHELISSTLGPRRFSTVPPVILVIGLPNTGKSTLINQFRLFGKLSMSANAGKRMDDASKELTEKMQAGGKARVGADPGVTRSISGFLVSGSKLAAGDNAAGTASPSVAAPAPGTDKLFLLDSPGIMLPYIPSSRAGVELGLKLAVIAALKESVVGEEVLARFALWLLNRNAEFAYVKMVGLDGPTSDLATLLWAVWQSQYAAKKTKQGSGNQQLALFHSFSRAAQQRRR